MSQPQLPRFEFTILKNKSVGDPSQVPSSGTVQLRRQGATVNQSASIPVTINDPEPIPTTVVVYDTGDIRPGDLLQVDNGNQNVLSVVEVLSATSLSLLNITQQAIALINGQRLVVSGASPSQPQFYSDPMGFVAIGSSFNADGGTGRMGAYVRSSRFDFLVTPTGDSVRLYVDHAPRFDNPAFADVRSHGSIQAAIDALPPEGGEVYAPAADYVVTATILIPKGKPVRLRGDGVGRTIISCANPNIDMLRVKGSFSTIEDLTIQGPNVEGSGRGIVLGLLAADNPTDVLRRVSIIGVTVTETASWALYIMGIDEPGAHSLHSLSIWGHVERSVFRENKRAKGKQTPDSNNPDDWEGLVWIGKGCTTQVFLNSAICFFVGHGLRGKGAFRVSLLECTFEDKLDDLMPYVSFDDGNNILLSGPWFETHQTADVTQPFIDIGRQLACRDVSVVAGRFVRHNGTYPRLVRVGNSSKAVWMANPACTMIPAVADDRFTTTDSAKKDINASEGCEVHVAGGLLAPLIGPPQPLAISNVQRTTIVATGPRVAVPPVTTTQRDDAQSLAFDRKTGDLVLNTDSQGLQLWSGLGWNSVVDRRGSAEGALTGIGGGSTVSGTLITGGKQGFYRISAYLIVDPLDPAVPVTVTISWQDQEGARSKVLLSQMTSGPGVNVAQADMVVLLAEGQSITFATTPSNPSTGVTYRIKLRAEAL